MSRQHAAKISAGDLFTWVFPRGVVERFDVGHIVAARRDSPTHGSFDSALTIQLPQGTGWIAKIHCGVDAIAAPYVGCWNAVALETLSKRNQIRRFDQEGVMRIFRIG